MTTLTEWVLDHKRLVVAFWIAVTIIDATSELAGRQPHEWILTLTSRPAHPPSPS